MCGWHSRCRNNQKECQKMSEWQSFSCQYCCMIIICVHQSQNWTKGRNAGKHCFYCNGFNVPVKRFNESVEFGTKLIMLPWPYPQATSVFSSWRSCHCQARNSGVGCWADMVCLISMQIIPSVEQFQSSNKLFLLLPAIPTSFHAGRHLKTRRPKWAP